MRHAKRNVRATMRSPLLALSGHGVMSDISPLSALKRTFVGRAKFMGSRPSTTLAESIFAAVFQGFAFGNTGTAGAAAEG